jgi:hypothetical protein
MPTSKAGYTCAVEPTVVKQITCIEEESIYDFVHCTTLGLLFPGADYRTTQHHFYNVPKHGSSGDIF